MTTLLVRILHVVPTYLPAVRYGGPIVSVHGLCRALARIGHDVRVFTTNVDGEGVSPVPLDSPVVIDGVAVSYFSVPIGRRLYWAPRMKAALERSVPGSSIVHTHSVFLWPTWAAARAARAHGVPYMVAPRGMLVPALVRGKSALAKRAWIAAIERRNLEQAAGVHVTSATEAADLRGFGFAYPTLFEVPNGVDAAGDPEPSEGLLPEAFRPLFAGNKPVLLYLGRINWKKGLDRLIAALPDVPTATLLLVGNDEEGYTAKLSEIARAHGVRDRVVFSGALYGPAKEALYRCATMLILSSISENFGNVVLEAMAVGCPVVVTQAVGASSIVSESGGGLVVSGEPSTLSAAIEIMLVNPGLRREMGRRGRSWVVANLSWESAATRMVAAYHQAIEGKCFRKSHHLS